MAAWRVAGACPGGALEVVEVLGVVVPPATVVDVVGLVVEVPAPDCFDEGPDEQLARSSAPAPTATAVQMERRIIRWSLMPFV
jgi:hypothetical protein